MSRLAVVFALVVLSGCIETDPGSGSSDALTIRDCEVAAYGSFPTGEVFSGSFSDVMMAEAVEWMHQAPGVEFDTSSLAPDVTCRQNGTNAGIVEGTGTATFNGTPGYNYRLRVDDTRPAPTSGSTAIAADAAADGGATFGAGQLVTIPSEVVVTAGDSSGAVVSLVIDGVTCTYDDVGGSFAFAGCSDASLDVGDLVDASVVSLHVEGGACPADDDDDDDDGHGVGRGGGHTSHGHGHGYGHDGHGHDGHDGHGSCSGGGHGRGHTHHGRGHGYGHDHHGHGCDCHGGGDTCVPLAVEATLATLTPSVGLPDFYQIIVTSPTGDVVYTFDGEIVNGDVDILFL